MLNSRTRPRLYTRSYRTDAASYDAAKVGWKVETLQRAANPELSGFERRKIYDTNLPGAETAGIPLETT